MKRRTLIITFAILIVVLIGMGGWLTSIDASSFDRPKAKYVCTSSATYAPGTGEQQTTMTCEEQ